MISVEDVHKKYFMGKNEFWALQGVSLKINAGEFVALSGGSGSGKTTLLNLLGCLDTPTKGSVTLNGKDISLLNDTSLAGLRAKSIGYIFQTFNLLPVLSVIENVEYPLIRHRISREERQKKALELLDRVGLSKHVHHRPDQLSGGQRQRVAIARALIHSPDFVVADEPTANLDSKTSEGILDILKELNQDTKQTVIIASHDSIVLDRSQRVIELKDGVVLK